MKKTYLLVVFCCHLVLGQSPLVGWTKNYGGSAADKAITVAQTPDGGYIMAGITFSTDGDVTPSASGQGNVWIVKIAPEGAVEWQRNIGGFLEEGAEAIRPTSDGGYIVAGYTKSNDADVSGNHGFGDTDDAWIVKLSSTGAIQWQKCYGSLGFDVANDIRETPDGGFIFCGTNDSNSGDVSDNKGAYDFWLTKIDANGTLMWNKSYGGSAIEIARAVRVAPDGGYVVCGSTSSNSGDVSGFHGAADMWVIKTDASGSIQWQNALGGAGSDLGYDLELTPDGGIVAAGITASTSQDVSGNHGGNDAWVVKLNALGMKVWQRCLGGTGYEIAQAVDVDELGRIIVAGYTTSANNGNVSGYNGGGDFWLVGLSSGGVVEWQNAMGGTGADWAFGVDATGNGEFIACGFTESSDIDVTDNNGGRDAWLVKLNPDPLSVDENLFETSKVFEQDGQLYWQLANGTPQTIQIVSMNGAVVLSNTLSDSDGSLDISRLSSGWHIARISTDAKVYFFRFFKR